VNANASVLARATSDENDRLLVAEEPLAGLQLRCGGELPGTIAVPAILETVRKARRYALKLGRTVVAFDGEQTITAWIEAGPRGDGQSGCDIVLRNWRGVPAGEDDPTREVMQRRETDSDLAELVVRLDPDQNVQAVHGEAGDLSELAAAMRKGAGRPWTDFVDVAGSGQYRPMHWRLLDGAQVRAPGSSRTWRTILDPIQTGESIAGFELRLAADEPLPRRDAMAALFGRNESVEQPALRPGIVRRDIAPVLRQPIARIVANAETIRSRLAGPLADDYANYAADIAAAGSHLLGLLDDLADMEVVEADNFATADDRIDLAEVARQAAGILTVRAREKAIVIDAPKAGERLPAIAEFRRVLQILLNLIGNAIRYGPAGSQIWIRLEDGGPRARIVVADQGPGMAVDDLDRVFEKFERLGRSGDGGSGLGLYISRRLARAMGGELSVESAPGQGARFTLDLPADGLATLPREPHQA